MNKMFCSRPSKLDSEIASNASLILEKSKYTFHGISAFFKHNFCLAPW